MNNEAMSTNGSKPKPSRQRLALAAVAGTVAALAGLGLIPSISHALGPANVAVHGSVGPGETILRVPPLGTISASTHPAPLRFELSFRAIDFEELGPLATTVGGRETLRAQMETDLSGVVRRGVLQLVFGGFLLGGVAAILLFGREWRYAAAGGVTSALVVASLLVATGVTYDMDAFEEPRYAGTLARAPIVIETLRERAGVLDDLRSRYETATGRLSDLLVLVARPDTDPRADATAILHVGDIHANPLGVEITQELARAFDVDLVIDTGDLGSNTLDTGSLSSLTDPIDRQLVDGIAAIEAPYLYVPGNHDSPGLLRTLGSADNVLLMEKQLEEVEDLEIVGWDDSTFTTDSTVTEEEKEQARAEEAPEVAELVGELTPDILAVHDERLAAESFGSVPLVLAGHAHERRLEEIDGTLLLRVGTTGATGLKSLTLETDKNYEAQVIYLRDGLPIAVDYVTFRGVSNDFQVERTTLDELGADAEEEGAAP